MAINAIGPFWDGNEVWLIVAGAAMFAAFPGWYATMFSGLYLALLLVLVALIVRGVSFEFRGKRRQPRAGGGCGRGRRPRQRRVPLLLGSASATCSPGCRSTPTASSPGTSSTCFTPYGVWRADAAVALRSCTARRSWR